MILQSRMTEAKGKHKMNSVALSYDLKLIQIFK